MWKLEGKDGSVSANSMHPYYRKAGFSRINIPAATEGTGVIPNTTAGTSGVARAAQSYGAVLTEADFRAGICRMAAR